MRAAGQAGGLRGGCRMLVLTLALLGGLVIVGGCADQPAASTVPSPEFHFDRAEVAFSDDVMPPQDGWRPQALPDAWSHEHPHFSGIAWYRLRFHLDALPVQAQALFVSRVAVTAQFRFNGVVLNPQVRFTPAAGRIGTQMTNFPQLHLLPIELFRLGENVVHVRLQGDTVTGARLAAAGVGPLEALRGPYLLREIPQRILPQVLFVLMSATLIFAAVIAWRVRRALYLQFTGVLALWTLLIGSYLYGDVPLTRHGIAVVLTLLVIFFFWSLLSLLWRFSGSHWTWFPRLLNGTSAATLLAAMAMALSGHLLEMLGALLLPSLLLRVLTTVMLAQWAWSERSLRAWALMLTEMLWFVGDLQFVAIRLDWLPPDPFVMSPGIALPLFVVLLYFYIERFIVDHDEVARDQQAAIERERSRILHDVHDGMGSQLITTLRLAQRPDTHPGVVARGIEAALQDLRLIIDSLDLADQDLLPLLGNLRYRLEPQLAALGIELQWRVQPLPALTGLDPQSALAVLRIVQEALNNAIRHARPTTITVTIAPSENGARIDIADDGIGFDMRAHSPGRHGLSGMRKRAARLGARLEWNRRDGGGTRVTLRLPLSADATG
jgi:signal transduction histidine kinase